jgi:hypothetical protein
MLHIRPKLRGVRVSIMLIHNMAVVEYRGWERLGGWRGNYCRENFVGR